MSNHDIKAIGMSQRTICIWILASILISVASWLIITQLRYANLIGALIVIQNVWRMSRGFGYGMALSVVLCLLTLAPLVGLITLVAMSYKTTAILREAGLHVGLLGAPKAELDNLN